MSRYRFIAAEKAQLLGRSAVSSPAGLDQRLLRLAAPPAIAVGRRPTPR